MGVLVELFGVGVWEETYFLEFCFPYFEMVCVWEEVDVYEGGK